MVSRENCHGIDENDAKYGVKRVSTMIFSENHRGTLTLHYGFPKPL